MSFIDSEKSVHGGRPVELFKFEGTYANYFYTSGPVDVDFEGDTYTAIAIKRGAVAAGTQEDDGLDITVELPVSADLVQTYGFSTPPPDLDLTIYRYHRGAPGDYVAYWHGPINNIKVTGGKATLRSPSALAHALVGTFPNVYYQTPCNHVLFDGRCGQIEANFTEATTVSAVNGREITVASVGALDGILAGGEIRLASGERRMIMMQSDNDLTVNFPFHDLAASAAVDLVAGCNHAYNGDCLGVFNNQLRYGGFPFMKAENVFTEGMEPAVELEDNTCLPFVPDNEDWLYEFMIVNECDAQSSDGWLNAKVESDGYAANFPYRNYSNWHKTASNGYGSYYVRRETEGQGHRYFIRVTRPIPAGPWSARFDNPNFSNPPGGFDFLVWGRAWNEEFYTKLFEGHYSTTAAVNTPDFNVPEITERS